MGLLGVLLCSFILLSVNAQAQETEVYGQCGGQGWIGPTTCVSGSVCTFSNRFYSQCIPRTTITSTSRSTDSRERLPSSFSWSSSGILISPEINSRNIAGIKDPSVVYYNGHYHVFTSIASDAGYSMAYLNFTDFSQAPKTPLFYLDQSGIGTGYCAAPQIFYFAPQRVWYLVFENGNAGYSTNSDISNPAGWSAVKNFYSDMPAIITNNIGNGYWVDMWVICDESHCYLFSSDDNGHLYRSQTHISDFPNGMSDPVIALENTTDIYAVFEASNVYKVNNEYLLIVEAIGDDNHRYFRSWTSPRIAGKWTGLADTESNPFARANNVVFEGTAWTEDISHGEMIRSSIDQTLTISPCNIRYLYQGDNPNANATGTLDYNALPWRIGLLTQTNSAC